MYRKVNQFDFRVFQIFQAEDGRTQIHVRFEQESVWLTQRQMGEVFDTTPENVLMHLKNIFQDAELDEAATTKDFLAVRTEGKRQVERKLKHCAGGLHPADRREQARRAGDDRQGHHQPHQRAERMSPLTEFAIQLLESQGYAVIHGPDLAPDGEAPEKNHFLKALDNKGISTKTPNICYEIKTFIYPTSKPEESFSKSPCFGVFRGFRGQ